jgi:hypothetical protein
VAVIGYNMAKCVQPQSVPHPHGTKRSVRLTVPCGKCINCFQNKRSDWTLRLLEELKTAESAHFITLTYDDDHIPQPVPELQKKDIQAFLKRLRWRVDKYHKSVEEKRSEALKMSPVRYFVVGEYGPRTLRPHYHGILFNVPNEKVEQWVLSAWSVDSQNLGFVHVGSVTQASIHYTTKYVLDALLSTGNFSDLKDSQGEWKVNPPFSLMSRRPGIGENYVKRYKSHHRNHQVDHYTYPGNIKQRLPRYYKTKIFNEHEREQFAKQNEQKAFEKEENERRKRASKGMSENYVYTQYEKSKENMLKKSKQRKI